MTGHHPPHIYLDDTWYIITASTLDHTRFLKADGAKELVRDKLKELVQEYKLKLRAWVILDNHYHLLLKTFRGRNSQFGTMVGARQAGEPFAMKNRVVSRLSRPRFGRLGKPVG